MHPEPSSNHHPEYENLSGHNSNYQELRDQALAISHTAPQVALMEGVHHQNVTIAKCSKKSK